MKRVAIILALLALAVLIALALIPLWVYLQIGRT